MQSDPAFDILADRTRASWNDRWITYVKSVGSLGS